MKKALAVAAEVVHKVVSADLDVALNNKPRAAKMSITMAKMGKHSKEILEQTGQLSQKVSMMLN